MEGPKVLAIPPTPTAHDNASFCSFRVEVNTFFYPGFFETPSRSIATIDLLMLKFEYFQNFLKIGKIKYSERYLMEFQKSP